MKRRATAIQLGIMVSSMFLSACGKNEAKEAANESAQVEEEGVGEVTEEGEKVEAENKKYIQVQNIATSNKNNNIDKYEYNPVIDTNEIPREASIFD